MKLLKVFLFLLAFMVSVPVLAVDGVTDYNTFHYYNYEGNWVSNFFLTQWANYEDWRDEMNDIATCHVCVKGPNLLDHFVNDKNKVDKAYNADLLSIQTHYARYVKKDGYLNDVIGKLHSFKWHTYLLTKQIEPVSGFAYKPHEIEIYIASACGFLSKTIATDWFIFRNMARAGALVIAGCAGTCYLTNPFYNSTWNEIGDEIADNEETIQTALKEGYDVWYASDVIGIDGFGKVSKKDCDDRADHVTFQNRLNYVKYSWGHDEKFVWPMPQNGHEVCGYYWGDW